MSRLYTIVSHTKRTKDEYEMKKDEKLDREEVAHLGKSLKT